MAILNIEKLMARSTNKASEIVDELYTSPAFKGSSECRTQGAGLMTWALTPASDMSKIDEMFADAERKAVLKL